MQRVLDKMYFKSFISVAKLLTTTEYRLSFRLILLKTRPAKHGCDSKILKPFPIEQIWPSSLPPEVRVPKYDA